jgi:alkyldihydroxyacetonephosphate synthase
VADRVDIGAMLKHALPSGVVEERGGRVWRVRPDNASEISRVLRLASEASVVVRPEGGEAGERGAIVLDLSGLADVHAINAEALTVHAGAGIRVRDLEVTLRDHGFTLGFPLVPHLNPKLGGFLSGQGWAESSVMYERPWLAAIGIEGVLPTGRPFRIKPAPRRAVGPDLSQLFLGSEGRLGVLTSAHVRFHPLHKARSIAAAVMPGLGEALACAARMVHQGLRLAFARVYEPGLVPGKQGLDAVGTVLVAGFEGEPRLVEILSSAACEIVREASGVIQPDDFHLACRPIRSPALGAEHADHLTATTGWSGAEVLARAVARVFGSGLAATRLSDFLHEGCAVTWTVRIDRAAETDGPVPAVIAEAAERVRSLGGTVTAHHGPYVVSPSAVLEADGSFDVLFSRLRAMLDPGTILNPSPGG